MEFLEFKVTPAAAVNTVLPVPVCISMICVPVGNATFPYDGIRT
jgi:hypothetical protein